MGSDPKIQPIRDEDVDGDCDEAAGARAGKRGEHAPTNSVRELLVERLGPDIVTLGVSGEGRPFAVVRDVDGTEATLAVRGKAFGGWLHVAARRHGVSSLSSHVKSDLVEHFAGVALGEARLCRPRVRVAVDANGDWLFDLGGSNWKAIHIRAGQCDLIPIPPLTLHRPNGILELPVPVAGGSLDELKAM